MQETGHGRGAALQSVRNLRERAAAEVAPFHRLALEGGNLRQSGRQPEALFVAISEELGREPAVVQPLRQAQRGLIQQALKRPLAADVALGSTKVAVCVGEVTRQNPPQPDHQLTRCSSAKLGGVAMGLQERLLDQVRPVELPLQKGTQLSSCEQQKVIAESVQAQRIWVGGRTHRNVAPALNRYAGG